MQKRILHICPYYGMSWIYNQLTNLSRYTPVVLYSRKIESQSYSLPHSYSLSDLGRFGNYLNRRFKIVFGFYPYYFMIARKHKPVLMHAHFGEFGYESLCLKRILNIPLVTTFYGYDMSSLPMLPGWRKKLRKLFKHGELFLAEGSHMKQRLVDLECPEEKVIIQRIGVNLSQIMYHPRVMEPDSQIRILICANLVEKKGVEYGIRAFAIARKQFSNLELRIAGDGPLRNDIERLIMQMGLSDLVELLGALDYAKYLEELDKSHILLAPSITSRDGKTEGGAPVVLTEAQAAGLPIVSTYHADIPEVVVCNKSGLLYEEKDVKGLARGLIYLLQNPTRWPEMGRAGRKHVERYYNLESQVKKLEVIYDSLINGSGEKDQDAKPYRLLDQVAR